MLPTVDLLDVTSIRLASVTRSGAQSNWLRVSVEHSALASSPQSSRPPRVLVDSYEPSSSMDPANMVHPTASYPVRIRLTFAETLKCTYTNNPYTIFVHTISILYSKGPHRELNLYSESFG